MNEIIIVLFTSITLLIVAHNSDKLRHIEKLIKKK